jgi:hypothetical protein
MPQLKVSQEKSKFQYFIEITSIYHNVNHLSVAQLMSQNWWGQKSKFFWFIGQNL